MNTPPTSSFEESLKIPATSRSHSKLTSQTLNEHQYLSMPQELSILQQKLSKANPTQCSASTISSLPNEILSQIFTHCLPSVDFLIPHHRHAPLLLGQISRHWRAIALATPQLWTSLYIHYKGPIDVAATSIWLSHSGDLPLNVSLAIDFGEQSQQPILDVIMRHAHRWQKVRFDFRHLICPPMYTLSAAHGRIPLLRSFEFHARDVSTSNIMPITQLLADAPGIREVTWADDLADMDALLRLPLARLTRLALVIDHGLLDYIELLDQCENLEHIRITRPCARPDPTRPPLILPKLTSLNIACDLMGVLDHLVLPTLKHVRVHAKHHAPAISAAMGMGDISPWSPSTLLSLLDRSSCAIESLWLDVPMKENDLIECLHRMSNSLVNLSVMSMGIGIGDLIIGALTPSKDDDKECLCPRLQNIQLDAPLSCAAGRVAAMVEQRLILTEEGKRRRIQSLRVLDDVKDIHRLVEMRNMGLKLEVVKRKETRVRRNHYRRKCPSR